MCHGTLVWPWKYPAQFGLRSKRTIESLAPLPETQEGSCTAAKLYSKNLEIADPWFTGKELGLTNYLAALAYLGRWYIVSRLFPPKQMRGCTHGAKAPSFRKSSQMPIFLFDWECRRGWKALLQSSQDYLAGLTPCGWETAKCNMKLGWMNQKIAMS